MRTIPPYLWIRPAEGQDGGAAAGNLDARWRQGSSLRAWRSARPREIEQLNILRASLLAMRRAVEQLPVLPELLLIDGRNAIPGCPLPQRTLVDGDAQDERIAAASIVAKVVRDRLMREYDRLYPGYGFAQHKGYATPLHLRQLQRLGPSPIHRRTFEPIASLIAQPLFTPGMESKPCPPYPSPIAWERGMG